MRGRLCLPRIPFAGLLPLPRLCGRGPGGWGRSAGINVTQPGTHPMPLPADCRANGDAKIHFIGIGVVNMAIDELSTLSAALNGDPEAFERLVEPYRRELLVHCYRFLGALEDAEDMLQETLLRAWRGRHSYAGRASFRAWLYKIATNVCLDGLDRRRARQLPNALTPAGVPGEPLPGAVLDPIW